MGKVKTVFYGALIRITGEKEAEVEASTLKEALEKLTSKYGENFNTRIFDSAGKPNRFINFYVNGKDVRFLNQLDTALNPGDEVLIIPAVGGG